METIDFREETELNILIVDDEMNIRKTLSLWLKSHGHQTRQADSASAVFSRPCLVNLVKFDPDFIDICLRNRYTGIKHTGVHFSVFFFHFDLDHFIKIHMIDCIGYKVCHNFFGLKFICPYIMAFRLFKQNFSTFLISQKFR